MSGGTLLVSLPDSSRQDIETLRIFLAPAREPTIRDWLDCLYNYKAAVAPPLNAFESYADGVVFALGGEPAVCWTAESLTLVMRTCTHWPEAAELAAILLPVADKLRQRVEDHDRATSAGKAVGSRAYMHKQIAAPAPPPPLRDQMRFGKQYADEEEERELAKQKRQRAEQLAELGHELDTAIRMFPPGCDPLVAARNRKRRQ